MWNRQRLKRNARVLLKANYSEGCCSRIDFILFNRIRLQFSKRSSKEQ